MDSKADWSDSSLDSGIRVCEQATSNGLSRLDKRRAVIGSPAMVHSTEAPFCWSVGAGVIRGWLGSFASSMSDVGERDSYLALLQRAKL